MERLSSHKLRSLLTFLREFYAHTSLDGFREHLVRNIREVIPCEIATYDEMNPDQHTSIDRGSPADAFPPAVSRLWQRVMHEHPVLMHCQKTGDLHSYRLSDFLPQSKYHRLALYNEYYKKIGIEDALCKGIRLSGPVVVGCGLHRTRRNFADSDRFVFDMIGPHLVQAWRNARALSRIQKEMRIIGRSFDHLHLGVIILDPRHRVRMMTAKAQRLLVECFGECEDAGRCLLPGQLRLWVQAQLSLVDSVDSLRPRTPLVIELEGKHVEFRLISNYAQNLLLVQERRSSADFRALLQLGLTHREAEILTWVAEGKTNLEIAMILALSPRTVQKHMEHIMAKLGVETRTAAARLALQAPEAS